MNTVQVVGKNILVKMKPREEVKNGIYMPDSYRSENQEGTLVCIGPDCSDTIRDKVVCGLVLKANTGTEVSPNLIDGSDSVFKVFKEEDVLIIY